MFSLNFVFLCSLTDELCTKEENDKTGCKLNFGHECICIPFLKIKNENARHFKINNIYL